MQATAQKHVGHHVIPKVVEVIGVPIVLVGYSVAPAFLPQMVLATYTSSWHELFYFVPIFLAVSLEMLEIRFLCPVRR